MTNLSKRIKKIHLIIAFRKYIISCGIRTDRVETELNRPTDRRVGAKDGYASQKSLIDTFHIPIHAWTLIATYCMSWIFCRHVCKNLGFSWLSI